MKIILNSLLITIVNIISYFVYQILASFALFSFFGSGNTGAKMAIWVSLSFVLFQIITLIILFVKKYLIKNIELLIINILIAISLFLYLEIYLQYSTL